MKLKIISQNLMDTPFLFPWRKRIRELAKKINEKNPEIIAFQECVFDKTIEILKEELKDYDLYRGNAKEIAIFSKIPIKNYHYEQYKRQAYWMPLSWGEWFANKGFQHIKFNYENEEINLINTHFLAPYTRFKSKLEREIFNLQVNHLIDYSKKIEGKFILCGDLNFGPNILKDTNSKKDFYLMIKDGLNLTNLYEDKKFSAPNFRIHSRLYKNKKFVKKFMPVQDQYDHVFLRGFNLRKIKQELVFDKRYLVERKKSYLSDHAGILTEINF